MARRTPLAESHAAGRALTGHYGPEEGGAIEFVQAFDPVEIEYAALRRHAAVFDQPHRGVLIFTGPDRVSFLNRMLTQELAKGFDPFITKRAFWLNRKGRIDADLRLIHLPDRLIADVDIFAAERARTELDKYLITEEVQIEDATERFHRMVVHGPAAAAVLAAASRHLEGNPVGDIARDRAGVVQIGAAEVIVDRWDWAGEIGLELLVPLEHAATVYQAISAPRSETEPDGSPGGSARRIGWHALNIARIEAGTPLYNVDFGPDSLPHETGEDVLRDRVSFTKGCYLGQEIVARMQSLGHPKQRVAALRVEAPADGPQAVTGTPVVDADSPEAPVVGAVTSSAIAPMLGSAPVAFAMVRWSHVAPGTRVWLQTDGARLPATVQDSLTFWPRRGQGL